MTCSKDCGRNARPGQRTCSECHAAYMREYRRRVGERRTHAAFFRGVEAMRTRALIEFRGSVQTQEITGFRAAQILEHLAVRPQW
jgi:hypothetical protein